MYVRLRGRLYIHACRSYGSSVTPRVPTFCSDTKEEIWPTEKTRRTKTDYCNTVFLSYKLTALVSLKLVTLLASIAESVM